MLFSELQPPSSRHVATRWAFGPLWCRTTVWPAPPASFVGCNGSHACVVCRIIRLYAVQATLSNPLNEKNLTSLEDLYNVSHKPSASLRPPHV